MSQYSWTSGSVRLHVLGKPCCIPLISFSYCGSPQSAVWIRSSDIMAILLLPGNVAIKAIDYII